MYRGRPTTSHDRRPSVWAGTSPVPASKRATAASSVSSIPRRLHAHHFGGNGDLTRCGDTTMVMTARGLFPAYPCCGGEPRSRRLRLGRRRLHAGAVGSVRAPDADPVDCPVADGGGHGSHVAGSAAGYGVNADGTAYIGALDDTIHTSYPNVTTAFRIGPGVAPRAALVAIRVFGCVGSPDPSAADAGR